MHDVICRKLIKITHNNTQYTVMRKCGKYWRKSTYVFHSKLACSTLAALWEFEEYSGKKLES